jgi:hypothetical protein
LIVGWLCTSFVIESLYVAIIIIIVLIFLQSGISYPTPTLLFFPGWGPAECVSTHSGRVKKCCREKNYFKAKSLPNPEFWVSRQFYFSPLQYVLEHHCSKPTKPF